MPMVDGDWTITRATGNIRYIGDDHGGASPSYATVIEFHRWVQAFADDASSTGDDEHDIIDDTATDRSTDNIITLLGVYNIDDGASEHLYDGSIIQGTGGTEAFYDGIVNFGTATVQIQILQDSVLLPDDWWNEAGAGLNADAAQGISHRFMIPTRAGGFDIDGRRLLATSRTFGDVYSEFPINGTARGNNVLALATSNDINNDTPAGTVSGWTGITITTEGYAGIDADNDGSDEFYYVEWNTNNPTRTITEFYERMKWLTRDGSGSGIFGINGEKFRGITHELVVDNPTSTFNDFEEVSWPGGKAQMLAINSTTAATKMWIQMLSGLIPTDGQLITGQASSATVDLNVTVTPRPLSFPMCGVATGAALLGAYGFGIEAADLAVADRVTDLDNVVVTPPNNVTFDMIGVVVGEDRILLTNDQAGAIDFGQFTLNGALTGGAVTTVTVNGAIPSDTPSSGTIRIERNSGIFTLHPYSVFSGSDFTITSHDFSTDNASDGNDTFISYLDLLAAATTESFTVPFLANRTLFGRVRDGGGTPIKTFESTAVLGTNGGSMVVQRVDDS